jgi:hypothetical protein
MVEDQVRAALIEDLGRAGDITTYATIGPERTARASSMPAMSSSSLKARRAPSFRPNRSR